MGPAHAYPQDPRGAISCTTWQTAQLAPQQSADFKAGENVEACVRQAERQWGVPLLKAFGMCSGNRGQGVSALEKQVLQQYLGARQLRDRAAVQRGDMSLPSRFGSDRPDSRAGADLVRRQWSAHAWRVCLPLFATAAMLIECASGCLSGLGLILRSNVASEERDACRLGVSPNRGIWGQW